MDTVDILLTNALVLTMDEQFHQYEPGSVAIRGKTIVAVGANAEIAAKYRAKETIDCKGQALLPGLINSHTHVPMTLLRGLADDLRLDVWLMGYVMPVEREFVSPEFVRLGTKIACAEMIRSGVTTFADMYYFEDDIAEATVEAGMRAVCFQTVLKFPTPDAQSYEDSLEASRLFLQKWSGHDTIIPGVAPHAPYTCTEEIMAAVIALAREFNAPMHIHISETALEVENMRKQHGMPVVPYVKKLNLLDNKVIAAHCVHIDEGEIRTLQHYHTGIAHNPSSNMKLASGMAPITRMLELGLNVGIGTDGTASNNDLDMFEEMRLASFLAKVNVGDPTALPAQTTLAMATRLGANALHIGQFTGSLEAGKRADLILLDLSPVHNSPRFRRDKQGPYAQIVYASKASDVTDVMINGKWVMRDRKLTTLDVDSLITASHEYAAKIDAFLIQREESILSKLIAIEGATEEESFEVQVKVAVPDINEIFTQLDHPDIHIIRKRHYKEYDTYLIFEEKEQGYLRFREDHFVNEEGNITHVRSRLTLIGPVSEDTLNRKVILSRSRYLAAATQSLRFYREYFKPVREQEIEKTRIRFLIDYKGTEFYLNLDAVHKPTLGQFLEIKSRTWSRQDAITKSRLVVELIEILGASINNSITGDYLNMVDK